MATLNDASNNGVANERQLLGNTLFLPSEADLLAFYISSNSGGQYSSFLDQDGNDYVVPSGKKLVLIGGSIFLGSTTTLGSAFFLGAGTSGVGSNSAAAPTAFNRMAAAFGSADFVQGKVHHFSSFVIFPAGYYPTVDASYGVGGGDGALFGHLVDV